MLSLILIALAMFSLFSVEVRVSGAVTPWLTKTEIIQNMKDLCTLHSNIASYESIGKTVQGNDIWLFRVGNNTSAKLLIDGALHGMESPGSHNIYFLFHWLLGGSPEANIAISRVQVLLVPIINYDRFTDTGSTVGDPTYRANAAGVDLNRNFVKGWALSAIDGGYYSGPYAASEPETQALRALFASEKPTVYVNMHDYGGNEATNGDFRAPSYANSNYTAKINELYNCYLSVCQSKGFTGWVKTTTGAFGSARDDGYNNGETLSLLVEETQTWGTVKESITYDLIYNVKAPHLRAFTIAFSDLCGSAPIPPPPTEENSVSLTISSFGIIG